MPELVLVLGGILLLAMGILNPPDARSSVRWGLGTGVLALGAMALNASPLEDSFAGLLAFDGLSSAGRLLVLGSLLASLLLSYPWLEKAGMQNAEYVSLLMLAAAALMGVCSSSSWIALLVFLETASIAFAAILGMRRSDSAGREAAVKYFILSAFASAFLVFGAAVLYAQVHGFSLAAPVMWDSTAVAGTLFIVAGLSFKCSLVPFHAWAPDTYEGGPTPLVAFIASASKVAGFTALARFFIAGGAGAFQGGGAVLWVLAVLSMLLGTVFALTQTNLKRMLAYSGISQAGYLVVAFMGVGETRMETVLVYLAVYTAMTLGAFAVVSALEDEGGTADTGSLAGWGMRRPVMAGALAVIMVSLTGLPPTAGFFAKFLAFREALSAGFLWLVLAAVLSSVISVGFYLRLLVPAFMEKGEDRTPVSPVAPGAAAIAVATAVFLLAAGLFPSLLFSLSSLFLTR
jgi:NADH-quinone oxidoreductase subunit N